MTGEPAHLSALIRWYSEVVGDAIPTKLHSSAVSEGGTPEWHAAFRAWLMAHPASVDHEGHVRSPLRFWLWVMRNEGRSGRVRSEFLWRLAACRYDWLAAVRTITPLTEDGEVIAQVYARDALQVFWRLMQTEPRREYHRPKSDAQHAAEEAA